MVKALPGFQIPDSIPDFTDSGLHFVWHGLAINKDSLQVVNHTFKHPKATADRLRPPVWGNDHVIHGTQWVVAWQRLRVRDVKSSSADLIGCESFDQSFSVHDRSWERNHDSNTQEGCSGVGKGGRGGGRTPMKKLVAECVFFNRSYFILLARLVSSRLR